MLSNVESVLDLADERVVEIERIYQETLQDQEVTGRLQALIREAVTGYRSALDRVANAVAREYKIRGRVYWPNALDPLKFDQVFDKNLPRLRETHPEIAQAWERYQSYQPGYEWIAVLMKLYRDEQHHDFTPQTRTERLRHVDASAGGGVVNWDPASVRMSGGVFINGRPVNPATQMTENTQRVISVDWLFADTHQSALGTLKAIQQSIRPMLQDVCSVSGL